jgi:hypothetical protein
MQESEQGFSTNFADFSKANANDFKAKMRI